MNQNTTEAIAVEEEAINRFHRRRERKREMSYSPKMGAIIYGLWLVVTRQREKERILQAAMD